MTRKRRKFAKNHRSASKSAPRVAKRRLRRRRNPENLRLCSGGEGWIRTSVRLRGQIYSLLPLTTRPPLHRCRQAGHVAVAIRSVNVPERGHERKIRPGREAGNYGRCNSSACARHANRAVAPRCARALHARQSPGLAARGAGEGNRTLVVSLEGFCSTIELHPHAVSGRAPCHLRLARVNQA